MRAGFSNVIQRPNVKVWSAVQRDTKAKESTYVQVKSEMHACVLLWFHGYCSQRVGSCWTDSQSVLLHRNSWKAMKRVMRVHLKIAKNLILHHDNAPAHAALSVVQFLTSRCITVMLQSPYSPDFTPCDFFLFQKVKLAVKEHNFDSTEDIWRVVTQALNDILQGAV